MKFTSVAARGVPTRCRSRPFVACCQAMPTPARNGSRSIHNGTDASPSPASDSTTATSASAPPTTPRHRDRDDAGGTESDPIQHESVQGLSRHNADREQRDADDADGDALRRDRERAGRAAGEHPERNRAFADAVDEPVTPRRPTGSAADEHERGRPDPNETSAATKPSPSRRPS